MNEETLRAKFEKDRAELRDLYSAIKAVASKSPKSERVREFGREAITVKEELLGIEYLEERAALFGDRKKELKKLLPTANRVIRDILGEAEVE